MGNLLKHVITKLLRLLSKQEIQDRQIAIGINSYTNIERDEHMLMLDYDTKNILTVMNDTKELSSFFHLSDYEIYRTNNGYHVFFWYDNTLPYSRLKLIIDYSRCDTSYKYISRYYNYKTIRASGKYLIQDITYIGAFTGKRIPTKDEREIAALKQKEYRALKNILVDESLLKESNKIECKD